MLLKILICSVLNSIFYCRTMQKNRFDLPDMKYSSRCDSLINLQLKESLAAF